MVPPYVGGDHCGIYGSPTAEMHLRYLCTRYRENAPTSSVPGTGAVLECPPPYDRYFPRVRHHENAEPYHPPQENRGTYHA